MWFFMYTCYIFSLLSLGMLAIVLAQSFNHFHIFNASPMAFLILTSIIYLFTETLVIFFFVGIGVSVKEYMLEHKITADYHKRMIAIKRYVYPPQLLNMLILMVAFIIYGAADTGKMSVWIYRGLLGFGFIHFCFAKALQHRAFRESTFVILDMAGVKH